MDCVIDDIMWLIGGDIFMILKYRYSPFYNVTSLNPLENL